MRTRTFYFLVNRKSLGWHSCMNKITKLKKKFIKIYYVLVMTEDWYSKWLWSPKFKSFNIRHVIEYLDHSKVTVKIFTLLQSLPCILSLDCWIKKHCGWIMEVGNTCNKSLARITQESFTRNSWCFTFNSWFLRSLHGV